MPNFEIFAGGEVGQWLQSALAEQIFAHLFLELGSRIYKQE